MPLRCEIRWGGIDNRGYQGCGSGSSMHLKDGASQLRKSLIGNQNVNAWEPGHQTISMGINNHICQQPTIPYHLQ